jgi:adenylosuccinate lyase
VETKNLMMPGHPRYQPKDLAKIFGHDTSYCGLARVEFANLQVLGEIGVIPPEVMIMLSPEIMSMVLDIPASSVDATEREVTQHDVRAWVLEAQKIMDPSIGRWLHVLLTSYDALDTGRILQYLDAHNILHEKIVRVVGIFADLAEKYAGQLQIGRTHGQHALPITVGFWLATILYRLLYNAKEMDRCANLLVGKISGAVGAYNAQIGLGIAELCAGGPTYEERVLAKLGLKPAPISTQILPPEPLAYYLHACTLMSVALGQFGRDCRHLMRSEIGEIAEAREPGQVGSSTMAHKQNPITFEGLEGDASDSIIEYLRVLENCISEHQRDLVGSRSSRRFPIIPITLCNQLNTLLRAKEGQEPFLARLVVNPERCQHNFKQSAKLILAEPLYIALQMAGYPGDAHKLVNDDLVPRARSRGFSVYSELACIEPDSWTSDDPLVIALRMIPKKTKDLLQHPEEYTGLAREKALEIVELARQYK